MWWTRIFQRSRASPAMTRLRRTPAPRTARPRLALERLEDRSLPSGYTAANVGELIAAIDAANLTPEADTITLAAGKTYTLTQVNNDRFGHGPTGLPTVAAGEDLTILGNGATIERGTQKGAPAFRLFDVAAGASLTLQNLTLQHGLIGASFWNEQSWHWEARGGAIYSLGTLGLSGVTVQYNTAQVGAGNDAAGGGIWS